MKDNCESLKLCGSSFNRVMYCRGRKLAAASSPLLMGILNVTPDSFSDGGEYLDAESALHHAGEMLASGAAIIDIGGESTRPGAAEVSVVEERHRTEPVIRAIRNSYPDSFISIDSTKYDVVSAALDAGADIINDVSGLQSEPRLAELAASTGAGLVIMHMRGTPRDMQHKTHYDNLLVEIGNFFRNAVSMACSYGVKKESICLDPGIGFAKDAEQNLAILANIATFSELGHPLLVGPSRKSFLASLLDGASPDGRLWGTAAAVAWLALSNVEFIRVHDVGEMSEMLKVLTVLRDKAGMES